MLLQFFGANEITIVLSCRDLVVYLETQDHQADLVKWYVHCCC